MSFFFLMVTAVTYWFSHFWAKRSQPLRPSTFEWTKNFKGTLEDFHKRLESYVRNHPQLLILEKTKHKYLISESPSLFEFGNFYHFHCEEKDGIVLVKMEIQPKLVKPAPKKALQLLQQIEDEDVGT